MRKTFCLVAGALAVALMSGGVQAQVAYLGTGGAPTGEGSNYHQGYGPAIQDALNPLLTALLYPELELRPSNGTGANIEACANERENLCFGLGQGDATPTYDAVINGDVVIVRADLPAECGFAFASNPEINNWNTVQKYARRITFYMPPNSGTADYFANLRRADNEFEGLDVRIEWVTGGAKALLDAVAEDPRGVGLTVTFPNPGGGIIKSAADRNFQVFGAASPAMRTLKHEDGSPMYQVNAGVPYKFAWLGFGETKTTVSLCAPAAIVATNPERLTDDLLREDLATLIRQAQRLDVAAFTPQRGPLARLFKEVNQLSTSVGLDRALTQIRETTANFVKELE